MFNGCGDNVPDFFLICALLFLNDERKIKQLVFKMVIPRLHSEEGKRWGGRA